MLRNQRAEEVGFPIIIGYHWLPGPAVRAWRPVAVVRLIDEWYYQRRLEREFPEAYAFFVRKGGERKSCWIVDYFGTESSHKSVIRM